MAEGNNLLRDVRQKLARLEDSIMFALFERAQYCFNSKIYTPGAIKIPSFVVHAGKKDFFTLDYPFTLSVQYFHGSFLDYLLQGTEFLHSTAGRYAHPEIVKSADIVTEMLEIKHPYQEGVNARKGIDF